jgi:nucleoside phosphorylase
MAANTLPQGSPLLSRDDYTIGWISALAIESAGAAEMLDTEHECLPIAPGDSNDYVLGRIGQHNVVMACINEAGGLPANIVATNLMKSFHNVRYILMVGIGGGIPSEEHQIRLGDIVVSQPSGKSGGVVQSDFGKWEMDGFKIVGSLNRPAEGLIRGMGAMKRQQLRNKSKIHSFVKHLPETFSDPKTWKYQGRENDPIYKEDLEPRQDGVCPECKQLEIEQAQPKPHAPDPKVHYGIIASGNQVIKNREQRDKLRDQLEACCVEMEAFGLMNNFPCLVIRGISDYADGRKNDKWQPYAALTAAAYAKELLLQLSSVQVEDTPKMGEQLEKR